MRGIDISGHQAGMDVGATDAEFVIVKATEGYNWYDPCMYGFATQVLDSGKLLGFYHFARTNSPETEAETFLSAVRQFLGRCILALDWEADAVSNGPSWAKRWLDYVYEQTGVKPIIYMSKSVCREWDWSEVAAEYELWAAQYPNYEPQGWNDNPWTDGGSFGAWGWDMPFIYQYSSVGGIPGYWGNLDKNICYASAEKWLEMEGADMAITNEEFERIFYDNWGYKNKSMNGEKDAYQLLSDAAKNSEKAVAALKNATAPAIDYDKLAAAIAPKIGDAIATKVADKLADRLKE